MGHRNSCCLSMAIGVWMGAGVAASGAAPTPVSPGGREHWVSIEGRCPSFSWTWMPETAGVELAVFMLPDLVDSTTTDLTGSELVLHERLPRGASTWAPSLERCLEPGRRYAWYVRGLLRGGDEAAADSAQAEWSSASLFEVSRRPSPEEVEAALDVLLRYREAGSGAPLETFDRLGNVRETARDDDASAPASGKHVVRGAQPLAIVPRLRVEGVISGDGSELTSVDAETLGGLVASDLVKVANLASSGQASVHWNNLTNVPSGLADGDDNLGPNSVGPGELAADAVRRSEIEETEVPLFVVPPYCGGGQLEDITLDTDCLSIQCAPIPTTYFNCAGGCTEILPLFCPTQRVGFLLSPDISN